MTQATLNPTVAGTVPWAIDPTHTEVEFSVRPLMISNVKGRFSQVMGNVELADDGSLRGLDVSIPVATVDTREEKRDAHLRSADFFEAEKHPTMTFRGRAVDGDVDGSFRLKGDLTIRGVTRPVTLDVALEGRGLDPWGNERRGYSASGKLDRRDFGLLWNQALETGGVVVGNDVKITINTELTRPAARS